MPQLAISRRTRSTPFTSRVEAAGVKSYTTYNHTLLATEFQSVEEDYWHLCQHVQVWDVSCERQVQIKGKDANKLVQWMTPRDISKAKSDRCLYIPLCDEHGKMVNDPIAINIAEDCWWLSIADSDVALWAKGLALGRGLDAEVTELNVWPVAVQGPKADALMQRVFGDAVNDIGFFRYNRLPWNGHEFLIARSGWSKQGGFEIYVDDAKQGQALWDELFTQGEDLQVGPGCPNLIERIESGLLSYGNDMGMAHTPLQCGLEKYCHLDRDIDSMSLPALRQQRDVGVDQRLVGIVVPGGMPSTPKQTDLHQQGESLGEVTSHCLSARYDAWLAFAIVDEPIATTHQTLQVETEFGTYQGLIAQLPFDFDQLPIEKRQE